MTTPRDDTGATTTQGDAGATTDQKRDFEHFHSLSAYLRTGTARPRVEGVDDEAAAAEDQLVQLFAAGGLPTSPSAFPIQVTPAQTPAETSSDDDLELVEVPGRNSYGGREPTSPTTYRRQPPLASVEGAASSTRVEGAASAARAEGGAASEARPPSVTPPEPALACTPVDAAAVALACMPKAKRPLPEPEAGDRGAARRRVAPPKSWAQRAARADPAEADLLERLVAPGRGPRLRELAGGCARFVAALEARYPHDSLCFVLFLDFVARHSACGRGQDECALDVRRLAAIFKSDPVILHAFIDLMPEWVYSPDMDLGSTTA